MANYNTKKSYTRHIEAESDDVIISYVDLMKDLGIYKDLDSLDPDIATNKEAIKEQATINKAIEDTLSFNITAYTRVYVNEIGSVYREYTVDDMTRDIAGCISINGNNLKNDIDAVGSMSLYNINALKVSLDRSALIRTIMESAGITEVQTILASTTVIDVLFNLETIEIDENGNRIQKQNQIYYQIQFPYTKTELPEEEEEEEEEKPIGGDIIIDDEDLGGNDDNDKETYYQFDNIIISEPEYEKYVFINSYSLYEIAKLTDRKLYTKDHTIRLHIEPSCIKEFSITLIINTPTLHSEQGVDTGGKSPIRTFIKNFHYVPSVISVNGYMYPRVQKMNSPNVSYALLRTNPKLTGNVKVVVDSNNNLYLDTFKVSNSLQQKKYRHIAVNENTYYGQSLMAKFKDVPTTDFYKVEDKCFNLFTTAQSYNSQYYDLYYYGVKTNDDDFYKENFALFAPLCVKEILPDFFLVFKIETDDARYNDDTMTDDEKIKYFISHGKIIKTYDFRKDAVLGKYIRKIYENSKQYPGDAYVSYSSSNFNQYIGISLDRGVVTNAYESYFDSEEITNQVEMNDFYTKGFERNRLVSKNIINFEFLFNDTDAKLFSINTYFGLYVKVNEEDHTFSCIGSKTAIPDNWNVEEMDDDSEIASIVDSFEKTYVFDSSIHTFEPGIKLSETRYANILYGLTTPTEFIKLNTGLYDNPIIENYMLKPYKNVSSISVKKIKANQYKSFLTLTLNRLLEVGDHIRVIDPRANTIYEVVTSNIEFFDDEHKTSDCTTTYYRERNKEYTIHYVSITIPYRKEFEDSSEDEINNELQKQIIQLFYAFRKFDTSIFTTYEYSSNSISFVGHKDNLVFERICSPSGFLDEQKTYIDVDESENDTITFYNNVHANKIVLNIEDDKWLSSKYSYLYPIHFEVLGNRMGYAIAFFKTSTADKYLYSAELKNSEIFDSTLLYYSYDNTLPNVYQQFKITGFSSVSDSSDDTIKEEYTYANVLQSFDKLNEVFYNLNNPKLNNNVLQLYNAFPINAGICSFLQLKDFDFTVLDNTSIISNSIDNKVVSENGGEFLNKTFFNVIRGLDSLNDASTYSPAEKDSFTGLQNLYGENNRPDASIEGSVDSNSFQYINFTKFTSDYNIPIYSIDPSLNKNALAELANSDILCYRIKHTETNIETVSIEDSENITYLFFPKDKCGILHSNLLYNAVLVPFSHFIRRSNQENYLSNYCDGWFYFTIEGIYRPEEEKLFDEESSASMDKPLTTVSEENIKDYIDKYRQYYDSSEEYLSAEKSSDYYENLFNNHHNALDISLTCPYACKWQGIGTDARGERIRIMHDYDSIKVPSYFAVGSKTFSEYIGFLFDKAYYTSECKYYNKYIPKSLNSLTNTLENNKNNTAFGIKEKDAILTANGNLSDILYSDSPSCTKLSIAYIAGEDTIEFISAGVKIRIKSNNTDAIDINKYNGYSAILVSLPDINRDTLRETELIIDEDKKELMFVWYQPVNTFRVLPDSFDADELVNSYKTYMCRIPCPFDIKEAETSYIIDGAGDTYRILKVNNKLSLPKSKLCEKYGAIWIGSTVVDNSIFSKYNRIVLTGRVSSSYPRPIDTNTESASDDLWKGEIDSDSFVYMPYYNTRAYTTSGSSASEHISTYSPFLWVNAWHSEATVSDITSKSYDYAKSIDCYLLTDNIKYVVNNIGDFNRLKNVSKNPAIYIKTAEGKKDYTEFKKLLTVSIIEPVDYYKYEGLGTTQKEKGEETYIRKDNKVEKLLGYAHSSYIEPVYNDMFEFVGGDISSESGSFDKKLYDIFEKSFDHANIIISAIKKIPQLWFNKYTDEFNYCVNESKDASTQNITRNYRASVTFKNDISLMNNAWNNKLYQRYSIETEENKEYFDYIPGYQTGFELKTFINSRGICLYGKDEDNTINNKIEIVSWKNTQISEADKYIKLDITDSIIYNILFRKAFNNCWKYLNLSDNTYKINYIKNTIIPFININNKTKFILYKGNQINNSLYFYSDYDPAKGTEVKNIKNELRYENGKYFMYIYPEEETVYYAKMIIEL